MCTDRTVKTKLNKKITARLEEPAAGLKDLPLCKRKGKKQK